MERGGKEGIEWGQRGMERRGDRSRLMKEFKAQKGC
jgi:hypothetical protein